MKVKIIIMIYSNIIIQYSSIKDNGKNAIFIKMYKSPKDIKYINNVLNINVITITALLLLVL